MHATWVLFGTTPCILHCSKDKTPDLRCQVYLFARERESQTQHIIGSGVYVALIQWSLCCFLAWEWCPILTAKEKKCRHRSMLKALFDDELFHLEQQAARIKYMPTRFVVSIIVIEKFVRCPRRYSWSSTRSCLFYCRIKRAQRSLRPFRWWNIGGP